MAGENEFMNCSLFPLFFAHKGPRFFRDCARKKHSSLSKHPLHRLDNLLHRKPEIPKGHIAGRGFAEGIDSDNPSLGTYVSVPALGKPGFHDDARGDCARQDGFPVRLFLRIEHIGGRHGDDAHAAISFSKYPRRIHGQWHLGAGGDEDDLGRALAVLANVTAAGDVLMRRGTGGFLVYHGLAGKDEAGGAGGSLDGGPPCHRGFQPIARAPQVHVGGAAKIGDLFHGLVGGAIFADGDGVVAVHEDVADSHERGHAQGIRGIFAEHEEGAAIGDEPPVEGYSVVDGAHAEFAHPVKEVVSGWVFSAECAGPGPFGEIGFGKIGGTPDEFGEQSAIGIEGGVGGLARGDLLGFLVG